MAGHTYKKVQNEETGRAKEQSDPADPSADSQFHLRLILCYGVVICTAIALTADGPLLPTMVTHLGGVSSSEAGTWIGIVQGSYSMAQLFVAPFMGYLSDVFGRKPIMLSGCVAMACGTFLFGFSSSIPMMIAVLGGPERGHGTVPPSPALQLYQRVLFGLACYYGWAGRHERGPSLPGGRSGGGRADGPRELAHLRRRSRRVLAHAARREPCSRPGGGGLAAWPSGACRAVWPGALRDSVRQPPLHSDGAVLAQFLLQRRGLGRPDHHSGPRLRPRWVRILGAGRGALLHHVRRDGRRVSGVGIRGPCEATRLKGRLHLGGVPAPGLGEPDHTDRRLAAVGRAARCRDGGERSRLHSADSVERGDDRGRDAGGQARYYARHVSRSGRLHARGRADLLRGTTSRAIWLPFGLLSFLYLAAMAIAIRGLPVDVDIDADRRTERRRRAPGDEDDDTDLHLERSLANELLLVAEDDVIFDADEMMQVEMLRRLADEQDQDYEEEF